MTPLGALILFLFCVAILAVPRKWALLTMVAGVLYLTQAMQVQVAGINLFAHRFLEIAGFIRVLSRKEISFRGLPLIDRSLLLVYGFTTAVFLLRSDENQAYRIGSTIDALLTYFIFRGLLRDFDDFRWLLRSCVFLLAPYVALLAVERFTGTSGFSVLGGITSSHFSRGDRPRCFGSFRHPSLLGTLGASFLPLYIALAFSLVDRFRAWIGIALCLAIVVASNSGGPLNATGFALLGWMLWRFRDRMQTVRRVSLVLIVLLALIMKAPIYYLPARLSAFTGGTGWHRSYLIEMFLKHWDQWWLAGMPIKGTADWFPYIIEGTGGADITNQFIAFALDAGFIAMILFAVLLVRAFQQVGQTLACLRSSTSEVTENERLMWGLGVVLGVHLATWFGITYFDQTFALWMLHLAAISNLTGLTKWESAPDVQIVEQSSAESSTNHASGWADKSLLLSLASGRACSVGDMPARLTSPAGGLLRNEAIPGQNLTANASCRNDFASFSWPPVQNRQVAKSQAKTFRFKFPRKSAGMTRNIPFLDQSRWDGTLIAT